MFASATFVFCLLPSILEKGTPIKQSLVFLQLCLLLLCYGQLLVNDAENIIIVLLLL